MIEPPKAVVAIVDDDQRVLDSLINLLESAGYDARAFPSASAFVSAGALASADALVTDISMPGVSGLDLEQRARRERPELPVILITGREEMWSQARGVALAPPLRALFRKPVDGDALLAAIETAVTKKRSGARES